MAAAANRWFKSTRRVGDPPPLVDRSGAGPLAVCCPEQDGQKRTKIETPQQHRKHSEQWCSPRRCNPSGPRSVVNNIARRFQRRLPPCVTFDDLASAGMIGLIQAVDRFDQTRGLQFKTYAQHRIWGAMQDFLRDEDPLSRTERRRVRASVQCNGLRNSARDSQPGSDPGTSSGLAQDQPAFTLRAEVQEGSPMPLPERESSDPIALRLRRHSREVAVEMHVNESPRLTDQNTGNLKASAPTRTDVQSRIARLLLDTPTHLPSSAVCGYGISITGACQKAVFLVDRWRIVTRNRTRPVRFRGRLSLIVAACAISGRCRRSLLPVAFHSLSRSSGRSSA